MGKGEPATGVSKNMGENEGTAGAAAATAGEGFAVGEAVLGTVVVEGNTNEF